MLSRHLHWYWSWLGLFCFEIISGCAVGPTHPSLQNKPLPNLIPAYTFYQSIHGYWHYHISPDGNYVAYRSSKNDVPSISIYNIASHKGSAIRSLYQRRIQDYTWLHDNRWIVFIQAVDKNNQHLFLADTASPAQPPVDLTPSIKGDLEIVDVGQSEPTLIWVQNSETQKYRFNLKRLNLVTHELSDIEKDNSHVIKWLMDRKDQVRARITREDDLSQHLEVYDFEEKVWAKLIDWEVDETVKFLGFDQDDHHMWLLSNRDRDRQSLVSLDLKNGTEKIFYEDPQADILKVTMSRKQQKPLVAYSYPDFPKIHFLDPVTENLLKPFQPPPPNGFHIIDTNADDSVIGFTVYSPKKNATFLLDTKIQRKYVWDDSPIDLYASELSGMQPISFQSRDGLILKGYLTLPKGVKPKNLPTVLLVHGGPWARDSWEYDNLVQFLANRGYAVLQVNFRGSTGYGKTYLRKAMGEYAGKMHDDLVDGVQWAIKQGYTDPGNVAIMGWSYGGYAALVGLTFTPNLFKCAIAIAGISDLTTHYAKKYDAVSPGSSNFLNKYVGDPRKGQDSETMKSKSPLTHVNQITRPLLIFHGGEDKTVASSESDQMVAAMQNAGKEVDYIFFPDEGHSFEKWENWSVLYRKVETFLAAHLGGRSETLSSSRPAGDTSPMWKDSRKR